MLGIRVKLIPAQNVVVLALMTGNFRKGKKFVFRYQLRAEGEDDLLRLVQRDNAVEVAIALKYLRKRREVVSFNGISRYRAFSSRRVYSSENSIYCSLLMPLLR